MTSLLTEEIASHPEAISRLIDREAERVQALVAALPPVDDPTAIALATTALPLPATLSEWLSPITAIVPGQLFALHLTLVRGLDPDRPRGLQKVTRTL